MPRYAVYTSLAGYMTCSTFSSLTEAAALFAASASAPGDCLVRIAYYDSQTHQDIPRRILAQVA